MIRVSEEVSAAVAGGLPVVALESTIFTHGLPRPRNLEVALEAESQIRSLGAVPASIGVVEGIPTVGLAHEEIERLAYDDTAVKASVRDLAIVSAKSLNAGTTVAATAFLAHRAGVTVFATGGLGGVHRGAPTSFDESADLPTLAGLPIVVVSAGVKSILDIPLTLERFETLGLAVVGYRTRDYPGFYVADSGYDIEYEASSPDEIALMAQRRDALGIHSALLVANPVPQSEQLAPELLDAVLQRAWVAADRAGISGNDTTPFLLDYIQRETKGESLEVNVAVYRGNAMLGARIAIAQADLR